MNNILKMELNINIIDNDLKNNEKKYVVTILNSSNNDEFEFSLHDETTENLKKFIDYLLENINNYDELIVDFYDDGSDSLKNIIGNNFKKIWEEEFKEVKNEILSL